MNIFVHHIAKNHCLLFLVRVCITQIILKKNRKVKSYPIKGNLYTPLNDALPSNYFSRTRYVQ